MGVNYRIPTPMIEPYVILGDSDLLVIGNPQGFGDVRYTLDGTEPTDKSLLYSEPLKIEENCVMKLAVFTESRHSSVITSEVMLARNAVEGYRYGLNYKYHEGAYNRVMPDFEKIEFLDSGYVKGLDLNLVPHRNENYSILFSGWINLPEDGVYEFFIKSDDGGELYIDDEYIVGSKKYMSNIAAKKIETKRGLYSFHIYYSQFLWSNRIQLWVKLPNAEEKIKLPAEYLMEMK